MKKGLVLLLGALLLATGAHAQSTTLDPIVVTATRTATPLSQIGSSVTVITAEEIEAKQYIQVLDVLKSVPGLTMVHSGPMGGQTSIRSRGTDNKHTLVLIDGIEFRDTSSIGGGANLANLSTDNVERIEIVRGAQSVIYGSDAIGGVINIITKKGEGQPQGSVAVEAGSYNTWRETATLSAGGEKTRSSFSVSKIDSDGFSSYNEDDGFDEDDGYERTNVVFNVGSDLSEHFTLNLNLRLTDSEYEFDSGYYDLSTYSYVQADTDAVVDSLEVAGRAEGIASLLDGKWTVILGTSITDTNRDTSGTYDNYEYDGRITKLDLQNNFIVGNNQTVVVGLETEKEEYTSSYGDEGDARTQAVFIQDQINVGAFSVALGVRVDDHEEFGNEATWRIAPTYTLAGTKTKIKGSAGTGFKAPSLFQLYYPFGGNSDLDPEKSKSYDVGFEQPLLGNSIIVSASWFYNDINDYIDWYSDGDFDYYDGDGYHNINRLKTKGVEATIDWLPSDRFSMQLGYTYTDTEDEDGNRRARIPLHKGTIDVNLEPIDHLKLNVNALYASKRDDGATTESLDEYILINLATSYQLNETLELFGRIDNLFDEDYEEAAGYGTAGLSAYAGVKVSF